MRSRGLLKKIMCSALAAVMVFSVTHVAVTPVQVPRAVEMAKIL